MRTPKMKNGMNIEKLCVQAGEKKILEDVNMSFELGKNYCLLGKNGSGKSTLSSVLAGSPKYEVVSGDMTMNNTNLLELSSEERSQQGIFLSFQNVPEIWGIRLSEYLRTIYNIHLKNSQPDTPELSPFIFQRFIKKFLQDLNIDEKFLDRDLNVGFSGGEKRKIEILQMKLIGPKYIILDEIDSGLDRDAFKMVAELLKSLNSSENTFIIITHYFEILEYIHVDYVYVLNSGKVVREWGSEIINSIKAEGYE